MRLRSLMLIALFPSMPLAGCNRDEHSTAEVEKHLTVTGPQSGSNGSQSYKDHFVRLCRCLRYNPWATSCTSHGDATSQL